MASSFDKDGKKEVIVDLATSVFLALYLGFVGYLVFSFLGIGGAFENPENVQKFWTYVLLGIVSVFVMFVAKLENFLTVFFKLRKYLPDSVKTFFDAFDVFIHEPRYSVFHKILDRKYIWWLNAFDLALFSLFAGSIFGLLSIILEQPLTQVYSFLFEQQITKTAQLGMAVEPASFGETMALMVGIGLLWGLSKWAVKKGIYNEMTHYFLTILIVPIFGGFVWMGLHSVVYGGFSQGLIVTFGWGWLQCFLGMLFVSVIPAYIGHAINNAFTKSKELFSTEATFLVILLFIILLGVIISIRVSFFVSRGEE